MSTLALESTNTLLLKSPSIKLLAELGVITASVIWASTVGSAEGVDDITVVLSLLLLPPQAVKSANTDMSSGVVVFTLHDQLELHGLSAGAQLSVDFKNIEDFCGGSGSLKISSDFNQSNSAAKSYSEIRANAGTLDWKLNNICMDLDGKSQLKLTADYKETYRATTTSNDLNLKADYETDSLKASCEYKLSASTEKTEIGDELLGTGSFKCREAIGKLAMEGNTGDAIFQLNSGEKIFYDWKEEKVLAFSSFGKFGFHSNSKFSSCYDAKAKVNRIKSGSYYLWTVTYDQSTGHYTGDSEKRIW